MRSKPRSIWYHAKRYVLWHKSAKYEKIAVLILWHVILRLFINIFFLPNTTSRGHSLLLNFASLENVVPYSTCFASIIKTKEAFSNESIKIISHNMYTIIMDLYRP